MVELITVLHEVHDLHVEQHLAPIAVRCDVSFFDRQSSTYFVTPGLFDCFWDFGFMGFDLIIILNDMDVLGYLPDMMQDKCTDVKLSVQCVRKLKRPLYTSQF